MHLEGAKRQTSGPDLFAQGGDKSDGTWHNCADDKGVHFWAQLLWIQLQPLSAFIWDGLLVSWLPAWMRDANFDNCLICIPAMHTVSV